MVLQSLLQTVSLVSGVTEQLILNPYDAVAISFWSLLHLQQKNKKGSMSTSANPAQHHHQHHHQHQHQHTHCGSSHLSRAFLVFVLSKCLQPSFVVSHLFSWQVLMMGPMCISLQGVVPLRIIVLPMVLALISTEWVTAQSMHSSRSSEIFCYQSRVESQILITTSRPSVKPCVLSPPELPVLN